MDRRGQAPRPQQSPRHGGGAARLHRQAQHRPLRSPRHPDSRRAGSPLRDPFGELLQGGHHRIQHPAGYDPPLHPPRCHHLQRRAGNSPLPQAELRYFRTCHYRKRRAAPHFRALLQDLQCLRIFGKCAQARACRRWRSDCGEVLPRSGGCQAPQDERADQ